MRSCPGSKLTLGLCAELGRLAPFGLANPGVTLLVDGCELADLQTVGDGKHLRFRVRQRGRDSGSAIAFGKGGAARRLRALGATTSSSGCRRTAGTASRRRSWSSGGSSTPTIATTSSASGWPRSGAPARRRGRPRRVRSSPSSSSPRRGYGAACSNRRRFGRCSRRRRRSRTRPRRCVRSRRGSSGVVSPLAGSRPRRARAAYARSG